MFSISLPGYTKAQPHVASLVDAFVRPELRESIDAPPASRNLHGKLPRCAGPLLPAALHMHTNVHIHTLTHKLTHTQQGNTPIHTMPKCNDPAELSARVCSELSCLYMFVVWVSCMCCRFSGLYRMLGRATRTSIQLFILSAEFLQIPPPHFGRMPADGIYQVKGTFVPGLGSPRRDVVVDARCATNACGRVKML